jgi:hypothetical protein
MATTAKGFPYPVAADGRPHIDQDIAALATVIDQLFGGFSDAEIGLLAGAGLFTGRTVFQTNAGSVRKQRGLYRYDTSFGPIAAFGTPTGYTPTLTVISGTDPTLNGGAVIGSYLQWGSLIIGRGSITIANGGTLGTGTYQVLLPVAVANQPNRVIGRWDLGTGTSPPHSWFGDLRVIDATHAELTMAGTGGGAAINLASTTTNMAIGTLGTTLLYAFRYLV